MFCNSCGTHIQAGQTACPSCGKATWTPAVGNTTPGVAPLIANRVAQHVNTLGILWIIYGVLTAIGGLVMLLIANAFFGPWMQGQETPMPPFIRPMIGFIGTLLVITALVRLLAGWALYAKQSWGRILASDPWIPVAHRFPVRHRYRHLHHLGAALAWSRTAIPSARLRTMKLVDV